LAIAENSNNSGDDVGGVGRGGNVTGGWGQQTPQRTCVISLMSNALSLLENCLKKMLLVAAR